MEAVGDKLSPECSPGISEGLAAWPWGLGSCLRSGKAPKASRLGPCFIPSLPALHPPRVLGDVISPALRGRGHPSSADNAES